MKAAAGKGVAILLMVICFVFWYVIASDYGDSVVAGTYHLAQNGETSTLILKPDHIFQQELNRAGKTEHADGTWRRSGEGGIEFSKEFLMASGQEREPDGTGFGEIHKQLGFLVSIELRQYHVLWYGRVDPSPNDTVSGTYAGDEPDVPATLVLNPNHTFEQTVSPLGKIAHAEGSWSVGQSGEITFSKAFLKTSGQALTEDETATAGDLPGSNLQILISRTSKSGVPTYHKRQMPW